MNRAKLKILFILSFTFGMFSSVWAQTTLKDFKLLLKQAAQEHKNNYAQALKYYTQAEIIAKENKWVGQECVVKNAFGNLYGDLSNYGEALNYYMQSWELAKKHPDSVHNEATILSNIARLYSRDHNQEKAIAYYTKAYAMAKENKSVYSQTLVAINFSDLYNKAGQYTKAKKYLDEVKTLPKPDRLQQAWEINYAENLFLKGYIKEAQQKIEKLLPSEESAKHPDCYVCVLELLSRIYEKQGKLGLAITYTKKGLQHNHELDGRINLYNQLAHLYHTQRDYKLALTYKDSVIQTKNSLTIRINNQLFETNKVKLDIQEYQNELKVNRQKQKEERIIFILIGLFGLIIFYIIYRGLRNRLIKQRQERELNQNKQKIIKLELKEMKNNAAEKNRELAAKAFYLSERNILIEEIINALTHLPNTSTNREIKSYIKNLKSYLKTDNDWEDFITHFEQVNPAFLKTLKSRHPKLTNNDIRFICYVYMNLDVKEISTIFSITAEATRKRKQRIAKKMDINIEEIHTYLLTLTETK